MTDFIYRNGVTLEDEHRIWLATFINKYLEWNNLAIKEGTTLQKNIGRLLGVPITWKLNNSDHWYDGKVDVSIDFLSQNTKRHQLAITFSEAHADENHYITNKIDTLFFDKTDAIKFNDLLNVETIKSGIRKQKVKVNAEMKFK
jgi:hypothetical protein